MAGRVLDRSLMISVKVDSSKSQSTFSTVINCPSLLTSLSHVLKSGMGIRLLRVQVVQAVQPLRSVQSPTSSSPAIGPRGRTDVGVGTTGRAVIFLLPALAAPALYAENFPA